MTGLEERALRLLKVQIQGRSYRFWLDLSLGGVSFRGCRCSSVYLAYY
jgi:hypothetical protein